MLYGDFLKLCKEKDLIDLVSFMVTPVSDMSSKIVVSAILEQYSAEMASLLGINVWNDRLSDEFVPPLLNLIAEKVDLFDFAKAYKIATRGLSPEQPGLEDEQLGNIIKNYVYQKQNELIALLLDDDLDQVTKDFIQSVFPSLNLNVEMQLINLLTEMEDKLEETLLLANEMEGELEETLLLANEMELRNLLGYTDKELSLEKDFILGLDIQFKNNPSVKVLKEYAKMLQSIGLDTTYYNVQDKQNKARGLIVQDDLFNLADKLVTFSDARASKLGLFSQANAHLTRANELREKSVSDIELANSEFGKASNTAKRLSR